MKMRCKKARRQISLALDSRLPAAGRKELHAHLHVCSACRDWQKEQQGFMALLNTSVALPQPAVDFGARIQERINRSSFAVAPGSFFPSLLKPALLRAAMFLLLILSALAGFMLSGRLDVPTVPSVAADFNQAMNLDAFADLPDGSFGAVYERLLQGGLQ